MNKYMRSTVTWSCLVIAVAVLSPAGALAQEPGDAAHQKMQAMAKAVTDAVYAMPQYTVFSNIDFNFAADGTVILTGMSASKELKSGICGVIQRVDGVTECTNNLYQLGTSQVDRELRAKIYASIYTKYLSSYSALRPGERMAGGNRFMGPHPIHIVEDKQHVDLYGWVYSEEDKASASRAVKVVPGVADVKNYLRVVPKPASR